MDPMESFTYRGHSFDEILAVLGNAGSTMQTITERASTALRSVPGATTNSGVGIFDANQQTWTAAANSVQSDLQQARVKHAAVQNIILEGNNQVTRIVTS